MVLPVDRNGVLDPDALREAVDDRTLLVSVMAVNNEIGVIQDLAAIGAVAAKIGCQAETLRTWVRQVERNEDLRPGPTTDDKARLKALEKEIHELRQANEILRKASAFFAQAELDRRGKW